MIDILVPVLGRPENAQPLVDSIEAATSVPFEIFFICSPGDRHQIEASQKTGASVLIADFQPGWADFAKKINFGYRNTSSEWIFMGADDLRFHLRWAENALAMRKRVVGTADLGNPEAARRKNFSTHVLIARSYVDERGTIDGPGQVLSEAYDHNWCDRELSTTAISRREWAYATNSIVEHMHPHWGKSKLDMTYDKGLKNFGADRLLYIQRMKAARLPLR